MSEKERMDYYRKKYGFEPKQTAPKPEQKAPETPEKTEKNEKPKKKGFFKRLFGGRK